MRVQVPSVHPNLYLLTMSNLTQPYNLINTAIKEIQKVETADLAELNLMKLQAHALVKLLNSLEGKND